MLRAALLALTTPPDTTVIPLFGRNSEGFLIFLLTYTATIVAGVLAIRRWVNDPVNRRIDALSDSIGLEKGKTVKAELNGFGERVDLLEEWQARYDESATERALIMERLAAAQERMFVQIGAAEKASAQCQADVEKMTRELTRLITRNHDESDAWERRVSMQLSNLITELATRGQISQQPPASPPLPRPIRRDDPE